MTLNYVPNMQGRASVVKHRTCEIDHCDGKMKITISAPTAFERPYISLLQLKKVSMVEILKNLGLPMSAPPRKPARYRDVYDSSRHTRTNLINMIDNYLFSHSLVKSTLGLSKQVIDI